MSVTMITGKYHLKGRAGLKANFARLQNNGVPHLFYISGEHLFGDDGEGSTDGPYPNNPGFMIWATIFAKVLEPILKTETPK